MKNNFSKNFAQLRQLNNMSKKQLSLQTGISEMAIGYYESGKRSPNLENLIKIAQFFEISLDRLVYSCADDLDKIDKVQLKLSDHVLSMTVPVAKMDVWMAALPYAGEIINSAMSAVKEVEKTRQPVNVTYTFEISGDKDTKGENLNE